ncbi:MAG: hypothetical protein ACKOCK_05480, partial [Chloroflexota bacterium]
MADPHQIPAVTADQMREVDHQAFDRCGVPGISFMEVAGRAVAEEARLMLGGDPRGQRVVLCLSVRAVWGWHGPHLWVVIAVAVRLGAGGRR